MRLNRRPVRPLALIACPALLACPGDVGQTTDAASSTGASSTGTGEPEPTSTGGTSTTTDGPPTPTTGPTATTGETGSESGSETGPVVDCATFVCGVGSQCCAADDECVGNACAPACASGVRCGEDLDECCAQGEVCVSGACAPLGGACADASECDGGAVCDPVLLHCVPPADPSGCILPEEASYALTELWVNDADEIMSIPVVADLDADGAVDIVYNTIRATGFDTDFSLGEIVRIDGATGEEQWRIEHDPANQRFGSNGRGSVALGDFSGDGLADIVYSGRPEGPLKLAPVHAVDGEGELLWTGHLADDSVVKLTIENGAAVTVNLDDDPQAEVAFGAAIFDHDGLLVWNQGGQGALVGSPHDVGKPTLLLHRGGMATFADLGGDGYPELITGREAWTIDWQPGSPPTVTLSQLWTAASGKGGDGFPAVADLDGNGTPEVILAAYPELKVLDGATGRLWCGIDPTGETCEDDDDLRTQPLQVGSSLGAPPTIADFDGDGRPEIALILGADFRVLDLHRAGEAIVKPMSEPNPSPGDIYIRWEQPVVDPSSSTTTAAAFDFRADGSAEVAYQDQCDLHVFDGPTGEVRARISNSSATGHENPVVVDLDGDGQAELLVVANLGDMSTNNDCTLRDPAFTPRKGIRAYHAAAPWPPTRQVWNMHSYHVTNAGSDGNPPLTEQDNWTVPGLNDFRSNVVGALDLGAPNLQLALDVDLADCGAGLTLRATVFNGGDVAVAPGVTVRFHAGTDADAPLLGEAATGELLVPGGKAVVSLEVPAGDAPQSFFAAVDGGGLVECFEADNTALVVDAKCPG